MKYLYLLPVVVFSFAACDSKQENQREKALEGQADSLENQADATRKAGERKADAIEDTKTNADRGQKEQAADATRKATENKADALENKADATREQK